MRIKKILLPVDGSPHSDRAAEYAVELAKTSGAEILVLHCHKPAPKFLGQPNFDQAAEKLSEQSGKIIDFYQTMLSMNNIPFDQLSVGGSAAQVITDTALAERCDLIVMGSKGKSNLEGLIIGSVTHKVLHLAPCPVLVTR